MPADPIPQFQPPPSSQSPTPPPSQPMVQSHDDPEEIDISKHHWEPRSTARSSQPSAGAGTDASNISEDQLRRMMLGVDSPGQNPFLGLGGQQPGATPPPGMEGMEQDHMMKMLSQMMAGGGMPGAGPGGPGGAANPFAGTGMENLFGSLAGGGMPNPMQQQAQQTASDKTANLWRILHAIFALGLGLYVALTTTFTGTQAEREHGTIASRGLGNDADAGQEYDYAYDGGVERTRAYFFYLFSSVEAVLLTTRYLLLDRNPSPPTGLVWSIAGFLPDPIQRYLRHGMRYFQIFSTVRGDLLVCIFVLGVCSWVRA